MPCQPIIRHFSDEGQNIIRQDGYIPMSQSLRDGVTAAINSRYCTQPLVHNLAY